MPERIRVSEVERELGFVAWRQTQGIDELLFDLDGTICRTRPVFLEKRYLCTQYIAEKSALPQYPLQKLFEELNDEYFKKYNVNPRRFGKVIEKIAGEYDIAPNITRKAKKIIYEIYKTPLEFLPGVEHALKFFQKTDTPMAVVTHANVKWTWKKWQWLGLSRFFDWENDVYIVDQKKPKDAEAWSKSAKYLRVDPARTAVAGDSPLSDMCAGEAGFSHLFLVGDDANKWKVHTSVAVPESVVRISGLAELCDMGVPLKETF